MARYGDKRLQVFRGTTSVRLAEDICRHIGVSLADADIGTFPDGEIKVIVNENVRGKDAFVVQSTCTPVNDSLMELLILIDALRRASAARITAVVPYYGYARQDRKTRGREPITAKLVADLLTRAGADRVLSVDLHSGQIQGFFDIPVDHLTAIDLLSEYFLGGDLTQHVVVSPDAGSIHRARAMARRLGLPVAIVDKRRIEPSVAQAMSIIGQVSGHHAILVDDMIDTGGSLLQAATALRGMGALSVAACATHAVFSGQAAENLAKAGFTDLIVTDTIPICQEHLPALRVLSVAPLIAEAIVRIHEGRSISEIFP